MRTVAVILAITVAFLAYEFYKIPVPDETVEPFKFRLVMVLIKASILKAKIEVFFSGKEANFKSMVELQRASYSPKPDSEENGIKIRNTNFGSIPVRIYEPQTRERNGPAVVYYHGGGWVLGSADGDDPEVVGKEWASKLNVMTVSVEYRMAPEHPFPIPFQDCVDATIYFLKHAAEYGVDPQRVGIAGASAGGNLAAAVALKLRDMKIKPQPKLQVLMVPVTQAIDFNTPSYVQNENDPLLPKETMVSMWLLYATGNTAHLVDTLNNRHVTKDVKAKMTKIINHDVITGRAGSTPEPTGGKQEVWDKLKDVMLDPYFAPLTAEDLSGLPPTFVYTAVQDVLRDDGILYAHRLKEAGNKVELMTDKAACHASILFFADSPDISKSLKKITRFLKENL